MKRFHITNIICALGLTACALLIAPIVRPANAASQTAVGIIQYNVKGGQGGWTSEENTRDKQVKLIADEVDALQKKGEPIDFITLEQADPPLLDGDFKQAGLTGWTTIGSQCRQSNPKDAPDRVQLSYSADWSLVSATGTQNPLVEGYKANACWKFGRPYNIAYLHNSKTGVDVLYVIVHMPHLPCSVPTTPQCFDMWHVPEFLTGVAKVLGSGITDLTKVNLIVSGDMNELGQDGQSADFANLFKPFGALTKSDNLDTCCTDSPPPFSLKFDHIVTNTGTISKAVIIDDGAYPIDPNFNKNHPHQPGHRDQHNEEHKAIYGAVKLPTQ